MKVGKLALLGGKPIKKKPFGEYNSIGKEEVRAVEQVLKRGIFSDFHGTYGERFFGGHYVREFQDKFAKYLGVKHVVGFNSATTALQAAVAACGIGPGDQVITSPLSMSATPSSILLNGALPVFADLNPKTFSLDPVSIEKNITKKTKAILTVNLFGGSNDYGKIIPIAKKYDLKLIEDNAQSIGAKYKNKYLGTIGDMGVFSFNRYKILQAGEGGALVTNNKKLAFRAELVRNHGESVVDQMYDKGKPFEPLVGSNYRLTELHAAIMATQLSKIKKLISTRVELGEYLTKKIKSFDFLSPPEIIPNTSFVYWFYPIHFNSKKIGINRDVFIKAMTEEGFPLGAGYVKPLYLMAFFQKKKIYPHSRFPFVIDGKSQKVSYKKGLCPNTEKLANETLLIVNSIHHFMATKDDIDLFVSGIEKVVANIDHLKQYKNKKI